jgi:hypothetical protein
MSRARILADYVSSGDELALKAPLASPAFTGTPTGITAAHITTGTIQSGVTFPAGHVLQVVSDNYNYQTEMSSEIKLCSITLQAKQANSKFYYQASITVGGQGDPDNIYIKLTKSAGTTAVASNYLPSDNIAPGAAAISDGEQYNSDNADIYQYAVNSISLSDLVISSHAEDDDITFGLWASGGCYINRSWGRSGNESGVTSLTIFEIGV